jgi:hypothetical protein
MMDGHCITVGVWRSRIDWVMWIDCHARKNYANVGAYRPKSWSATAGYIPTFHVEEFYAIFLFVISLENVRDYMVERYGTLDEQCPCQ